MKQKKQIRKVMAAFLLSAVLIVQCAGVSLTGYAIDTSSKDSLQIEAVQDTQSAANESENSTDSDKDAQDAQSDNTSGNVAATGASSSALSTQTATASVSASSEAGLQTEDSEADLEADDSLYKGYTENDTYFSLDILKKDSTGASEVVYCFNKTKDPPPSETYYNPAYYSKHSADADTLASAVDKPLVSSSSELYSNIMRVMYYGYPNNKNLPDSQNLQKIGGLTDEQYRYTTQFAIWHYTDSVGIENKDWNSTDLAQIGGNTDYLKKLVNYQGSVPSDYKLDIFKYEQGGKSGRDYQWLMSSNQSTSGKPIVETTHSLTVSKQVTGTGADKTEEFAIDFILYDADGNPINGNFSGTMKEKNEVLGTDYEIPTTIQIVDGKTSFSYVHGYEVSITGLPEGYSYTVSENADSSYLTKINGTTDEDRSISAQNVTADVSISFENNREVVVPDNPTSDSGNLSITKDYIAPLTATLPHQDFSFKISPMDVTEGQTVGGLPLYDGVGDSQTKTVSFEDDVEAVEETDPNGHSFTGTMGSATLNFGEYAFTKPGVYRYQVQEVAGEMTSITYDTRSYTVDVYVVYDDNNQLTATYVTAANEQGTYEHVVFKNELQTRYLKVTKLVAGSEADKTQQFGFYFSVNDPEKRYNAGAPITISVWNANGEWVRDTHVGVDKSTYITLTAGQTWEIKNLPVGMTVSMQENTSTAQGYSVTLKNPDGSIDTDQKIEHVVAASDDGPHYTFTNKKGVVLPSAGGSGLYFAILGGIGFIILALLIWLNLQQPHKRFL